MDEQHSFGLPHAGQPQAIGHAKMRAANLGLVLRHLRDHGGCSRASLAAQTGLSKATISSVVADLVRNELCEEGGSEVPRRVGHPSVEVRLRPAGACGVGIELTRDQLVLSVVNLAGETLVEESAALHSHRDDAASVVQQAAQLVRRHLDALEAPVVACTLAAPGIIDYERGAIRFAPALGWTKVPVHELFRSHLGFPLPVYVENDAKLSALSSYADHRSRQVRDLIHVTAGAGIGVGIVADGHLVRGWAGFSGEIGHTMLDPDGPPCPCGRRGCLELSVGWPAFVRGLRSEGVDIHADSTLSELILPLRSRMLAGEQAIVDAAAATGSDLARGLQPVVDLLNPKTLVLGGYLGFLGEALVPVLEREFAEARIDVGTAVEVLPCQHGLNAAARGAAMMALERVFVDPTVIRST
ncbi:MAG: ROK family transcriptional regulator [Propionibacteriaceae bacterium]|nr:ROK family transcriptional regulator [Propionibacteriaceae bacterium]